MSDLPYAPDQVVVRTGARLPASMRKDPGPVVRAYWNAVQINGLATDVIAAASDPASPMYEYFTWNDLEAADKERLREAFALGTSFVDAATGEPLFVSTYHKTNNIADARRIHFNVRLLPPESAPPPAPRLVYTIGTAPEREAPVYTMHPAVMELVAPTPPQSEVIDDPSLDVFRRWVVAHKHEPVLLREAWRILRDAL